MSNSTAIAATTSALRNLLDQRLNVDITNDPASDPNLQGTVVTTRPPDEARALGHARQLNLFLYHTEINSAWRNQDMPQQVRSGEAGHPPLPLNLYYLLTPYVRDDREDTLQLTHRILGRAMSVLHDHAVFSREELRKALEGSDLGDQLERLRIVLQPISLEDLSKLWTTFQGQFRFSVAYQVSVVLIESNLASRAPLPVLRRGDDDRGGTAMASPPPTLSEARPAAGPQPSARLGEDVLLIGERLSGQGATIRFSNQHLVAPLERPSLAGGTSDQQIVHLPSATEDPTAQVNWVPGFYTVALILQRPGLPDWPTNEVPLTLAPRITVAPATATAGDVVLTITCSPRPRSGQHVVLLFGDRQFLNYSSTEPPDASQPGQLTFVVPGATAGTYVVRLRVDGVDSLPTIRTGTPLRLEFDPNQKVTIT